MLITHEQLAESMVPRKKKQRKNSRTPMMHLHCLNLSIATAIVAPRTNGVFGACLLTSIIGETLGHRHSLCKTNCLSPSTFDFSKRNNTFSSCRKSLGKTLLTVTFLWNWRSSLPTLDKNYWWIYEVIAWLRNIWSNLHLVSQPQTKHRLISFLLLSKFIRFCSSMPK